MRLKIFSSHPVQYHVPYIRELMASGIDVEVGYYHQGTAGHVGHDVGFGIDFEWDIDLLSGYDYQVFFEGKATYSLREQIGLATRVVTWALKDRKTPLLLIGWFVHLIWLIWLLRILIGGTVLLLSENNLASAAMSNPSRSRKWILGWLLRHSSACLYIGELNREFYLKHGVASERLFHVPYSVDNQRFLKTIEQLMPKRDTLCHEFQLDPHMPTFLFCGKLIEKKRPLHLLDAYLASGLQDSTQLLFVGDGAMRSAIETRVRHANAHHVHLIGFLNQTQMPLAYVLGELLFLVSDATETWGLVVNEAMACGRPVITADTVGCSVDLVRPENGWVVALDDHDGLVHTLRAANEAYREWPQMGDRGRQSIQANSFTAMAEGTLASLQYVSKDSR